MSAPLPETPTKSDKPDKPDSPDSPEALTTSGPVDASSHHSHHASPSHHSHTHHHGLSSPAPSVSHRIFAIAIGLNLLFVGAELIAGWWSQSLALIADAGHNASDVLGLGIAWSGAYLATKAASRRRTYGYKRATILAALASGVLLVVALVVISWEAIGRFTDPLPIQGMPVIVVAGIGVLINSLTAWFLASGRERDVNLRGAYLHMVADAAVSVAVMVAGIGVLTTGWTWIDPAISLAVVAVVAVGTFSLLRESVDLAVDAVPRHIDPEEVQNFLERAEGVTEVHDLHIWPLSTTEAALTAHLTMPEGAGSDDFLARLRQELGDNFQIQHTTFQVERGDGLTPCDPC